MNKITCQCWKICKIKFFSDVVESTDCSEFKENMYIDYLTYIFSDLIAPVGPNPGGERYNKAKSKISLFVTLLYNGFDYAGPAIISIFAFSKFCPVFEFVRDVLNLRELCIYIATLFRVAIGFPTLALGLIMLSIFGICMLITIYGIVTPYLWTLVITPPVRGKCIQNYSHLFIQWII